MSSKLEHPSKLSPNLRVLHVIPSLSLRHGGPSVIARTLASGLARAGMKVDVVTTDAEDMGRMRVPLNQPLVEDGVTYRYFRRQTRFYTASLPLAQWLGRHVGEYDLVHIHALFSFSSIAAAAAAARCGVPYIVRPLGTLNQWGMINRRPMLKQLSFNLFERRILAGAASIHYTSEQERAEAATLGVNQPSVVIPNPIEIVDDHLFSVKGRLRERYPQLANRTLILFLARIDPKKGLDLLLPAFAEARVQCPELALVMAGSGDSDYIASLQAEAKRLGRAEAIVCPGFLDGDDKLAALADADLFVLPSYSENFGNAVVEAMVCRLPVIISDKVGIHSAVSEANAGLIASTESDSLAAAMLSLATDVKRRQAMGVCGQRLAQMQFSTLTVISKLLDLYTTIHESKLRTHHRTPLESRGGAVD